tara:strand:+ start:606 stop:842 length:237 start_codon:yes stop_codon:yes gene_type:complete
MESKTTKEELRQRLKQKVFEKSLGRNTRKAQEKIFNDSLNKLGIDKDKLKNDLERVNKQQTTNDSTNENNAEIKLKQN